MLQKFSLDVIKVSVTLFRYFLLRNGCSGCTKPKQAEGKYSILDHRCHLGIQEQHWSQSYTLTVNLS